MTKQHSNQFVDGIIKSISNLFANVTIKCTTNASNAGIRSGFRKSGISGSAFGKFTQTGFQIAFDLTSSENCVIMIDRQESIFTVTEKQLLGRIPDAVSALLITDSSRNLELAQRIAARMSFEHLLIAKFLRGGHAATYWTPAHVLFQLQELTSKAYEGQACTSGFIYTSHPELYIPRLQKTPYELLKFPNEVRISDIQFEMPAAYRYVDGRNAFYLIDNQQKVHGIIKSKTPQLFNIIARSSCQHVDPLVETMPGRVWAAFNGMNNDVNIRLTGQVHLQWVKGHWHLRDKISLSNILLAHACTEELIGSLLPTIFALSELRFGAILLIQTNSTENPAVIGAIDSSKLGKSLQQIINGLTLFQLISANSVLGILSSDGLTHISNDGRILGCGEIIDLRSVSEEHVAGGGRTQAAKAASFYGIAIKISEDGPITFWENGKKSFELR